MNSYTEPKGTNKYTILEIIDNGQIDFIVECAYIEKRYIFWGELILKSSPLKRIIRDATGLQIEVFAKFKSIEDAQIAINKINSNSVRVVKEIEKPRT